MNEPQRCEVVVVGGGAAGRSAALVLGRARVEVVLVDAGSPSNLPAEGIGGLLGHDGMPPAELYARSDAELARYPSVTKVDGAVVAVEASPTGPRWLVRLDEGRAYATDRLLLATGMRYDRPDLPGIERFWGRSVFHCPFCHGWEVRDQPLAVLGGGPMLVERALLLRRWTDDLLVLDGAGDLGAGDRCRLAEAGIRVVDAAATAFLGDEHLEAVELSNGDRVAVRGVLVPAPHVDRAGNGFVDALGVDRAPTGHIAVDGFGATSVPGVWAAGDTTGPMTNVAKAVADGSLAAVGITRDIVAAGVPVG